MRPRNAKRITPCRGMPRGNGRTGLDDLVLLCGPCHTTLHAETRTIYRDASGTWRTRPATPDETPAACPDDTRNTIRRE